MSRASITPEELKMLLSNPNVRVISRERVSPVAPQPPKVAGSEKIRPAKTTRESALKTILQLDGYPYRFKSKTEMLFAESLMSEETTALVEWEYEPVTIALNDGSGERYTPDFLLKHKNGLREFIEIKPFGWTPKEGRLGISKMKRGAKRLKELFGAYLYKGSHHKGQWFMEQVTVSGKVLK